MDKRFQRFDNRLSKCLNPVSFYRDGKLFTVACGRCDACLLQKANDWSFRLADEIHSSPFSLFFTLTYQNEFLPVAKFDSRSMTYSSNNDRNKRVTIDSEGNRVIKSRNDIEDIYIQEQDVPITHYDYQDEKYIAYLSKKDIQLFKKNLRNLITKTYGTTKSDRQRTFRSFIIGEYGPTHYRPHYHGIIFFDDSELAQFAAKQGLYQSWQMCDKTLFQKYVKYCDANTSLYLTQYVTSFSNLPTLYKSKEIAPFRLASKSPAIGFRSFDYAQVWRQIERGNYQFSKSVTSSESNYLFPFPSGVIDRLLPKCREFSKLPFSRLLSVYGKLYKYVVERCFNEQVVFNRLRSNLQPQDWYAARRCYQTCIEQGCTPFHYVFVLDNFYYYQEMAKLKRFYEYQESCRGDFKKIFAAYTNLDAYYKSSVTSPYHRYVLRLFFKPFGFTLEDVDVTMFAVDASEITALQVIYDDIKQDMVKLPKAYSAAGISPNNQF